LLFSKETTAVSISELHIDDILRSTNSLHGTLKGAPMHAFGLFNVVAGAARGAELST
jgi:hypothetical protein